MRKRKFHQPQRIFIYRTEFLYQLLEWYEVSAVLTAKKSIYQTLETKLIIHILDGKSINQSNDLKMN